MVGVIEDVVQNILEWSKTILASSPARWQYLVDTYPIDLLSLPPAPQEWSALECLQHLVDVERLSTGVRLKAFLTGESFPAFYPAEQSTKEAPTIALAAEFARLRQANLHLLEQVTEADLGREALHAEYGMVNLSQFLHHLAAHDLMHTVQAEQAIMQPLIKGVGPWHVNYTAHLAKA